MSYKTFTAAASTYSANKYNSRTETEPLGTSKIKYDAGSYNASTHSGYVANAYKLTAVASYNRLTTSHYQDFTSNITRISMLCRNADARYIIGDVTANTNSSDENYLIVNNGTSHFIAKDERLDLRIPTSSRIAFVRDTDASADAILEITELS
tara:strand:+ start:477 stop:935 length:459 start_codon:yes stop_codon:yes gene_type:complete